MKKFCRSSLLLLLPVLLPVLLPAQEVAPDDTTDPQAGDAADGRRYAVEIIIFRYEQLDSVGTEVFVPEPLEDGTGLPEFGDATVNVPADAGREGGDLPAELRYRLLEPDEYTLQETANRLRRLQAYEPLMHFGWVQEALPEADTPPLDLERFGTPPDGLEGSLTLKLSRFLHLGVDLSLAANEPYTPPVRASADDSSQSQPDPGLRAGAPPRFAPLRWELKETRIIKSGETRYFDHPQFGVIARITRADEERGGSAGR